MDRTPSRGPGEASVKLVHRWSRHTSDSSPPVQVSRCGFLQRWGRFVLLKGRAGCGRVGTFLHATRENLEFFLHPKEALFVFRYCYMALILKMQEFWFGRCGNGEKESMISVITITWLASSYLNGDGWLTVLSKFVKQADNSSNLSDIHKIRWPKSCIYTKITSNKLQKWQQLKRAKDMN